MNSRKRVLKLLIPIDSIKQYLEPVLHTVGHLMPTEEIVKIEIAQDWNAPWNGTQDIPVEVTIQKTKKVSRTEIDGKSPKSL